MADKQPVYRFLISFGVLLWALLSSRGGGFSGLAGAVVCPGTYLVLDVRSLAALSNCSSITTELDINCPQCTEEDIIEYLDNLVFVEDIYIHSVGSSSVTLSNLEIVNDLLTVDTSAVVVHFPKMNFAYRIIVSGGSAFTTFDAPILGNIGDYLMLQSTATGLTQFSVPQLKVIECCDYSGVWIEAPALTVLDMPELEAIRWDWTMTNSGVAVINMPKLKMVYDYVTWRGNADLIDISSLWNPQFAVLSTLHCSGSPNLCCSQLTTLEETASIEGGIVSKDCAPC
ncbi:hypothetical protein Pelo_13500 [Pelomyxa schiedti]|nr:hypothetical protein Pelo_13500 [Pelomyxa schiedti]